MCTVITYATKNHYFGRNLDLELSYNETVTVTPRNYVFSYRHVDEKKANLSLIGMATVVDQYPLYYDATNEKGLSMAGLNFPANADYKPVETGKVNIASFELIPWLLTQCETVEDVKAKMKDVNITNTAFSEQLPPSPLHWMVSDRNQSIVIEAVADGIHIYDDPVGVMTNNPTFDKQLFNLNNYRYLSNRTLPETFAPGLPLDEYSRGMGGMGLPGDLSSASRFVKVAWTKMNSVSGDSESESISQFFHILGSVDQQRGCCEVAPEQYEITIYSSCVNVDKGIYYYTTYENSQITAVDMHKENLDGDTIITYPLIKGQQIHYCN